MMIDINTLILLGIFVVLIGIGFIHVYKLKKQCTRELGLVDYKVIKQAVALTDDKIIELEIRVKVLEDHELPK